MDNITVLIYTPKNIDVGDCINTAKLLTQNIILVYPDSNFVETVRESGIKQAKTGWALILDADERLTKELAEEIKEILRGVYAKRSRSAQDDKVGAYKIPRKNIFGKNKWLLHGGWWPDYQIRLINKKNFKSWPKRIHSAPIIKGNISFLKNPIIHYFHGDLEKMVEKTIIFENIESNLLFEAGKTAGTLTFFRKLIAELWRRLFIKLGFLDGPIGIIESIYQAFSKTITYLFLYEKRNKSRTL